MAVMEMQRVSICALKKDRGAILDRLQEMGVMEMSPVADEDEEFQKIDTTNARQESERNVRAVELALGVLEQIVPEKRSLFAGLEGKRPVERKLFEGTAAKEVALMESAAELVELSKEIAEAKGDILKLENQIESLSPWMPLDVPMSLEGTARTAMLLGTMEPETSLEDVYELVAERAPQAEGVELWMIGRDKTAIYLTVLCMKEERAEVENALRAGGFVKPAYLASRTPRVARAECEAEKGRLNQQIAELQRQIEAKAGLREELKMLSDHLRIQGERYETLGTLPQSRQTVMISGYVPEASVPEVQRKIGDQFDCVIDVEVLKEDEEPPVILKNNGFSASMEGVVESYALPRRGELDPTAWMSFFYVFFFGMMLSDAAYGAILAAGCFVLEKRFLRMSEGMRRAVRMFRYCGISTLVWGILFGGYFGNAVEVISQTFFGKRVAIPALWFAPLDDPMKLLVYSLGFGLVHLFAGLGIKGYLLVKASRMMDFFCDVVLWYFLVAGLILMLIPTELFASIVRSQIRFSPIVNLLARALAITGGVGLLFLSGRKQKNPALRLALGAYDLYNITGWLGDVLSYSRLLALGLATGVIASVINQMAGMVGGGLMGAVIFTIIFVTGHTLNLAVNLLGAYVHTNRLQFVEFFGKFYEGGGRAFAPFKIDTKYVTVREEKEEYENGKHME